MCTPSQILYPFSLRERERKMRAICTIGSIIRSPRKLRSLPELDDLT